MDELAEKLIAEQAAEKLELHPDDFREFIGEVRRLIVRYVDLAEPQETRVRAVVAALVNLA